jgi:hypothetical protein
MGQDEGGARVQRSGDHRGFVRLGITHDRLIGANNCCCLGQGASHVGENHCRSRRESNISAQAEGRPGARAC